MADLNLSIFKLDNQTITIKDTTARQAAESANTLATTASGNATTALNKINELESEKADAIISSASGAIASFQDGAEAPVKSLTVGIEPVQEGTGDPSPDNVRPISGWTGAKVTRTGKNLWRFDSSYSASDYRIILNRVPFALKAGTYTFSAVPNIEDNSVVLFGYHADGTRTEIARLVASTTRKSQTGIISKDVVSLYFVSNVAGTISNIQLELGSTATDYEPYQGETYDITFPSEAGTVYGGSLDVTTGVLTVGRASVDLGTLTWSSWEQGGSRIFNASISDKMPTRTSPCVCTNYAYNANIFGKWDDLLNGQITGQIGGTMIYIRDTAYSDNTTFKTAMSGVQLVYELATPITYQLTPQEVETLLGTNNIWADTGDTSVTYRADTKLYIDKKFTELQALILEN